MTRGSSTSVPRIGLVVAAVVLALAGCDPQTSATTPRGVGARPAADGSLELWFPGGCRDVLRVELDFVRDEGQPDVSQVLSAPADPGPPTPGITPDVSPGDGVPSVDGLTVGRPVDGLRADVALPDGFDWRDYRNVRVLVRTVDGQGAAYVLTDRLDDAADHPDEWFVQDAGWRAESADDVTGICTGTTG